MSAPLAHSAAACPALASEPTAIGEQMLVCGVAPITSAQRLALRADAPLAPRKPQRPINHGLFDIVSRTQIEMF